MNRSYFSTALILTTILTAGGARTFADSKIRIGGGGSVRSHANTQHGNNQGNRSGMQKGPYVPPNGNTGVVGPLARGIKISGRSGNSHQGSQLPHRDSNHTTPHVGKIPGVHLPGNFGSQHSRHSGANVKFPSSLSNQLGHMIQLPNGTKTKSVAVNVNQILKHHGSSNHSQPQIQNIVAGAPQHLCGQPHFSWWVSVCHDHCHSNYGCWDTQTSYWDCWTPCNWQVVQCQQFSYFVGLNCIHIPDMQAYGVQSVINGSPAQQAGLQSGDLILTVNGQPVFDQTLINTELAKGRLDLQVVRQGAPAPVPLTVFPRLVQTVSF